MSDLAAVERLLRPTTKIVWVETPSNPLLRVVDIAALAGLAHRVGARCVVDNTWATPVLQRPLALGADLVMHSTTKYLGGHSDLIGGALVARVDDDYTAKLRAPPGTRRRHPVALRLLAAAPRHPLAPLAHARPLRQRGGRRALPLDPPRASRPCTIPVCRSHPAHDVAARQMSDFGGMLSIQLRGGESAAIALTNRLTLFTRATSLGGPESLIEHRASVEGPTTISPRNLLRVSVGLENAEDLIEDLDRALG